MLIDLEATFEVTRYRGTPPQNGEKMRLICHESCGSRFMDSLVHECPEGTSQGPFPTVESAGSSGSLCMMKLNNYLAAAAYAGGKLQGSKNLDETQIAEPEIP